MPWEAVPSMWGPPGRAFAWSRGEGGDTSNPRLSRGGKPLSPGDTWSCLSYWGHVCLSYVVSVMFVLYCLIGLIGPPRPKVGQVRTVAPGGGAAGGRWAGADIQRPTCKNMHAFACARACARAHLSNERDRRVARARAERRVRSTNYAVGILRRGSLFAAAMAGASAARMGWRPGGGPRSARRGRSTTTTGMECAAAAV